MTITSWGYKKYESKCEYSEYRVDHHRILKAGDYLNTGSISHLLKDRIDEWCDHATFSQNVNLHRNLSQKQYMFALRIAPDTAVKQLDSIAPNHNGWVTSCMKRLGYIG